MKKYIPLMLLLIFAMSCEDGLLVTIPAESGVTVTISSSQINSDPDNQFSAATPVDVSQFFDENSQQIESIKLDRLTYEVAGYENTSGNVVLMDLRISTKLDGVTTDILVVSGLILDNTGEVIAFEDGNPASQLSAAQVASLESIMDNLEPFELEIFTDFTDDVDGDFEISVNWAISASIAQESGS